MQRKAFTLAEVLITLGIIGVVATATLPTTIKKYQNKVLAEGIKKDYSLISQSIQKSACMIENSNWVKELDQTKSSDLTNQQRIEVFENCIVGNLKRTQIYGYTVPKSSSGFPTYKNPDGTLTAPTTGTGSIFYTMKLANGSFVFIHFSDNSDGSLTVPYIWIDTNGKNDPNILGKDLFHFYLDYDSKLKIPGIDNSRDVIIEKCNSNIASQYWIMCSALVMKDGWEFSEDYLNLLK